MNFNNLWLTRVSPEGNNRINEFLQSGIIAIGWSKLGDMRNKDKNKISEELAKNGYNNSNVTVGVLNHFFNNMKVGDLCIIPDQSNIYLAQINSEYYFEPAKVKDKYPHQRKVKFINKNNPFNRNKLPESIRKSLGAQNTVANLNHRIPEMKNFLQTQFTSSNTNIENELIKLLPKALENIKEAIRSNDIEIRTKVSFDIIKLLKLNNND
ncbi:hypothetical protein [Clostridium sp. HV4-5-A1G]|uniref:hypothetical protein n=1 Tax=Clostridium sp. HV4-5-A1G TaxID=2004595 RepID=UPI00123A07B2|nr:hypothetical protein [Clostridium sp. HV4-5-A1G]KAA8675282.1 hypothetical protein F3O63_05160 [Clostridium sp. HV4-5-A1G]